MTFVDRKTGEAALSLSLTRMGPLSVLTVVKGLMTCFRVFGLGFRV